MDYLEENLDAKNIGILLMFATGIRMGELVALKHDVFDRNTCLIMEQMGHTDMTCTENHYHRNRRSIDAKSQIISSIPDFQAK